jgi:acyl dehydratase
MGQRSKLTGRNNYFEDFDVGAVIKHARGKTITPLEDILITNLVMNTAQGHFNARLMANSRVGGVISYGGVNFSIVLGLASQDCCESALAELGLDNIHLAKVIGHGDTLYAISEVLSKEDADREDAGVVVVRHFGYNQYDEIAHVERKALVKRASHWGEQ